MNSRDRVFRTLKHETPDRVPVDVWLSKGTKEKIAAAWKMTEAEFLDAHDVDFRYIEGPRYVGPALRKFPDGTEEDLWGVRRTRVNAWTPEGREHYEELARSPLATATTPDEIENYSHWPSPDWYDFSDIARQCETVRRKGRVAVFVGDRLNRVAQLKPAMYLRGVEAIFMDMSLNPEVAHAIFRRIRTFYAAYMTRILDAANGRLDIFLTGDDFGSQNGPLVSPAMWTEFLGEGFADYVRLATSNNVRVMHHSCGSIRPIIPLLAERGLDILQSLQPEAAGMDPREIKAEFGKRLAFQGGISVQKTLPFGTPEDVRREVKRVRETLAPGGGYIFCTSHNIQADAPLRNIQALLDAYREYGNY
ncbi:MAG: uroporphyrinogen decarboxylase family protein [Planctomycetota bacterium]